MFYPTYRLGRIGGSQVTVLTVRKHQRFAVRRMMRLSKANGRWLGGLLVELSLEGCRIGNIKNETFAVGQMIKVRIEGFGDRLAEVRWSQPGIAGMRFAQALHNAELDGLLRLCRGECDGEREMRAYGT